MIWLAKLLGLWGWLKQAAVSVFRWALAHPWQAALILAVCGLFWQHRAIGQRDETIAARDVTIAQQSALIAEMQAKAKAVRAQSVTIAKKADQDHEQRSKAGAVATDRYIANRRIMQPQSGVGAPAAVEGAGSNQDAPAVPLVAVSEQDVRIASALQDYANTCHAWGQELIAAGLAD